MPLKVADNAGSHPTGVSRAVLLRPLVALVVVVVSAAALGACAAAKSEPPAELTIDGRQIVDAAQVQTAGEQAMQATLNFGYVAKAGDEPVRCWFARVNLESEVDSRLWCGPVQVPGSPPAVDWVPVPMKSVEHNDVAVRVEAQTPQVPAVGNRSTPVGQLVRADGSKHNPASPQGELSAGSDFLAVLPDDGHRSNADIGLAEASGIRIRDDLLSVRATGWGKPDSFRLEDGSTLRAEPGLQLHVLRLHVERLFNIDPAFQQGPWAGWGPQQSTLSLDLPGRRQEVPADRLPDNGDVFLIYTVPTDTSTNAGAGAPNGKSGATGEGLVLNTVGVNSLEQRIAVPSGEHAASDPNSLRRAAGPPTAPQLSQQITVGEHAAMLHVTSVKFGRQRPVKSSAGDYSLATATDPNRALLEIGLQAQGDDLPVTPAGLLTKDRISVWLPDQSEARQVGVRYDGALFPVAVVVEVPADVTTVTVGLTAGAVNLTSSGRITLNPVGQPMPVVLNF
ncbi:hypothetical protein [Goodfellowiella coeruleoviolacea]|uniref:Uncharacterized protein n=1 Tax=Goodfellowiella coeruleoviolacea TaxID=334858 RepID=A0AAE3KKN0_9PSEU|nr:hypothetical protein [Goodfellowiella coeruleoviolacea]MCP2165593.1 hypothetical protein [Goodfellowiella coeruleoviolacea]